MIFMIWSSTWSVRFSERANSWKNQVKTNQNSSWSQQLSWFIWVMIHNCHVTLSLFSSGHNFYITWYLTAIKTQLAHAHTIIVYNMCIFLAITHSTLVHHDHHLVQPRKKIILLSSLTLSSSSISISFFSTIFFSLFSVSESALRVDT